MNYGDSFCKVTDLIDGVEFVVGMLRFSFSLLYPHCLWDAHTAIYFDYWELL